MIYERIKTIIIANTAEAFEPLLVKTNNSFQGIKRINHEQSLSQRAFFWEGDNKVVITPYPINQDLNTLNSKILDYSNVYNLSPKDTGLNLSDAIIKDKQLFEKLCNIIRVNPGISISPYAITSSFLKLIRCLKKEIPNLSTINLPEKRSEWTVAHLDTKAAFRQEISKLNKGGIKVNCPEGYICKNKNEAIKKISWFIDRKRKFVVKANKGESGWGMIIGKRFSSEVISTITKTINSDPIWENDLIIVEELIDVDKMNLGGSPSVEVYISNENPNILYTSAQVIKKGEFMGIGMGPINKLLKKELESTALIIGKRYWTLGYRGYFDIDFVLDKKGKHFGVETNTRRTGGTHVFDVKKQIEKQGNRAKFLISEDCFQYASENISPSFLLESISNLLFNADHGIMITLINPWNPVIGYIAIGNTKKEVLMIQKMFKETFSHQ